MTFDLIKASALAIICCVTPSAAIAAAPTEQSLEVYIDQTQLLPLPRAAGSLIVGNPEVAAVAVHDDHTLLLTGRSFGSTNLIVLDNAGAMIYRGQIMVGENAAGQSLTIARGLETETLSCTTKCRPVKTGISSD